MPVRREREPKLGRYPIPGLIRRTRRIAGLSQIDIAQAAGVSRATVQKAETGERVPSLDVLQRILAAAGLHLVVIDDEGHIIQPMGEWTVPMDDRDGVRNGAGRRYPAHLDVVLDPKQGEWWADGFGFARPPETFYRDPPDLREYRRRLSEWQVRRARFQGRRPPVPPVSWFAAQRARLRRTRPEEPRSPDSDVGSPDVGSPDVGSSDVASSDMDMRSPDVDGSDVDGWDVDEWDGDE